MKLTVMLVDTWRTQMALNYENSYMPYIRRTVQIELTAEQIKAIQPRKVGEDRGKYVFEEIGEVWLEANESNSN